MLNVEERLIKMINTEVSLDPTVEIEASTDLLLTGLVDSLGVVQIVGWIEDELAIDVDPLDVILDNFQTVGQMVAYIDRHLPPVDEAEESLTTGLVE